MSSEQNILGAMPIRKLVLHMSWPIVLSMLVQAVYNLVDSIFVARVSEEAFLALSYAYPIQTLLIAFCVGTGVAFAATLSKRLGQGNLKEACSSVLHGLILFLGCWLLFLAFALFGASAFLQACTDTPEVAQMGTEYLRICCGLSIGVCMQFPLERILQSTGHPAGFMIIQGSGAIINLILDPVLIFGFNMGVRGAAIATVIGQITGALIGFCLLIRIRKQLPLTLKGFRFRPAIIKEIAVIAVPAILMQSLASVMSLGLNSILQLWSETAVWVMGAYFKIQSFVFMPIFSVNNALIAIISYNYGSNEKKRAVGAIRFGLELGIGTALVGAVLLSLIAHPLLDFCFEAGEAALALGVPSLRISALSFPIAAVSIIFSAAFQSLGYSRYSLYVSLLRFVVLLLPIALLLTLTIPEQVFFSFLLTELGAAFIAILLYRRVKHKTLDVDSKANPLY